MSFQIAQFRCSIFVIENVEFEWQCSQHLDLDPACGTERMDEKRFRSSALDSAERRLGPWMDRLRELRAYGNERVLVWTVQTMYIAV